MIEVGQIESNTGQKAPSLRIMLSVGLQSADSRGKPVARRGHFPILPEALPISHSVKKL
jgi:hypothetical protein